LIDRIHQRAHVVSHARFAAIQGWAYNCINFA